MATTPINASSVLDIFPQTVTQIDKQYNAYHDAANVAIEKIISIPKQQRTFHNTIKAFDEASCHFDTILRVLSTLEMVHPDIQMRAKAQEILRQAQLVMNSAFTSNSSIYKAFIEYKEEAYKKETLSKEQRTHFKDKIKSFKMTGLELDHVHFTRLLELTIQLDELEEKFYANIAEDSSSLYVKHEELAGLDEQYIASLERDSDMYILPNDSSTYDYVLSFCTVESTRRAYYRLYENKAYPHNEAILKQVVTLRHEMATLLGYASFAEFDMAPQMAKNTHTVLQFLESKMSDAIENATKNLRMLNNSESIYPWNVLYLSTIYNKKFLEVDQEKVAEYFPLEHTLKEMLRIFGTFFTWQFTILPTHDLWHHDAIFVEVTDLRNKKIIGHIVFDLFPRPNKYTHCCCNGIRSQANGNSALAVVITNFTRPTPNKPSLLSMQEVVTLFHEFGHAVHDIAGVAEMTSSCGSNTEMDFVESPSQLFEEWAMDPEILTQISRHFQTGLPLDYNTAARLKSIKTLDNGTSGTTTAEISYSLQSLSIFGDTPNQDFRLMESTILQKLKPLVFVDREVNSLCSFEHLIGYGAKYYTYLWSKDISRKFFNYIKTHGGLLDPKMGDRYLNLVIGKGGSVPATELVENFLRVH